MAILRVTWTVSNQDAWGARIFPALRTRQGHRAGNQVRQHEPDDRQSGNDRLRRGLLLGGLLIGAAWGAIFGFFAQWATGGRRDLVQGGATRAAAADSRERRVA
jgi:hypothetical protein